MQYKKKEVSDKILAAGRREYLEKGFRGGNISVIASQAGVPVGNLYRYYDGKLGLLTAIVRPAYLQVPKMIDELFSISDTKEEETASVLGAKLVEVFDKYGTDILILADKCEGTRYDDFFERLVRQCDGLLRKRLFPETHGEDDEFFSKLIARSFLGSVFDVLRQGYEREKTLEMTLKLVRFFFFGAEERLGNAAPVGGGDE